MNTKLSRKKKLVIIIKEGKHLSCPPSQKKSAQHDICAKGLGNVSEANC